MNVGKTKIRIKKPNRPPAFELFDQALGLFGEQQYSAADAVVDKGLRLAPRNAALWNLSAACALRLGDAARAEHAWRQALLAEPRNALFHSNLAMLLGELARLDEAEALCRRALDLDERLPIAHFNLGVVLGKTGRTEEAERCYRRVLALEPRHADAGFNLGVLLAAQQRYKEAEQAYRQTLTINPARVDALVNLGVALIALRRNDEAEDCFRSALQRRPGSSEAATNLGGLLMRLNRRAEAAQLFTRAGTERSALTMANLALLFKSQGRFAEAEGTLRDALAIETDSLSANIALGELLDERGRHTEARHFFYHAMRMHPDSALPVGALAYSLARSGETEQAEYWFRLSIERTHDVTQSRAVYATWLLTEGRYEEGFAHYEARHSPDGVDPFQLPPDTETPRWTGEDLHGRSILIWPEQGFGDQIQFCRYAELLKARGAAHVAMVTHAPLIPLLSRVQAIDEVLGFLDFKARRNAYDYWSYVMSLPLHCGTTASTIPVRLPYLTPPPERIEQWRDRLPPLGRRVGLVWKGAKGHKNDINRSLPGLDALAPLWTVPGIEFVSLQKGQGEDEAAAPPVMQPLHDLGSQIRDFADTAAIVQQLDLVICVDTAIAHLAGALNKPCWVLLPIHVDWRWQRQGEDSPWYPQCMRLFRQTTIGDWTTPVRQLRDRLEAWANCVDTRHAAELDA